jgi:single-stranded-DNA-specific exonuclease
MSDNPHKWIQRDTSVSTVSETVNGYSKAFSRLLYSRGLKTKPEVEAFLKPSLDKLHDPFLMPGARAAVSRIKQAIEKDEKIHIFGDYDADGIISAALMYNFLGKIAEYPEVYIPDRINEGYDLSLEFLKSVSGKADLVISVDCGTNNEQSQEYILNNPNSPDVIACDHHNPNLGKYNDDLRYIVVNPKLPGTDYPFRELSGAGVTFKFLIAVLRSLDGGKKKIFKREKKYLPKLLDLVAISTLADLMPLTGENRILVSKGLERIQETSNPGLKTLIDISLPNVERIKEYDIGFVLAPRLNAAGRVKDAMDSFRLLSDGDADSHKISKDLDACNIDRQEQQKDTFEEIISKYDPASRIPGEKIFIEYSSRWNEGILGIVASDMVKAFNIPIILFRERDGLLKGSGRSIKEFSLHKNLEKVKNLFIRFGGHDLACGITLESAKFDEFRKKMLSLAGNSLKDEDLLKKFKYDIELGFNEINTGFIQDIEMLRPFGKGNPSPSFITRDCIVREIRKLKDGKHMKFSLEKGGYVHEGIFFNVDGSKSSMIASGNIVDILYDLGINSWMGKQSIQLIVRDLFQKK